MLESKSVAIKDKPGLQNRELQNSGIFLILISHKTALPRFPNLQDMVLEELSFTEIWWESQSVNTLVE